MKAVFAGSFDPFTIGHKSIVERASALFDSVVVAIGINENKKSLWPVDTREKVISDLFADNPKVKVMSYTGLTTSFAREIGAGVLLRGVRGNSDFEYERNLADANKAISGLDTVFLITDPELSFVSSSMVRELIHNGFNARKYIAGDFPSPIEKGIPEDTFN